ncbi:MFS alpha-glucoside [Colletotrichum plurivorum]|uniref:MFS alpha-glucoside n=1 Tax=Colletotrichum plurivorum TaxID=2175906 RepID=A0A8H6JSM8_9PEZI|nr:MFS alpha-glucoside [Colletotrichum plurivorum]
MCAADQTQREITKKRVQYQDTFSFPTRQERRERKQEQQKLLLNISIEIFENALKNPMAFRITHRASICPFAASIVLRMSQRNDLILRAGLRMTSEPGKQYVPTFHNPDIARGRGPAFSRILASHKESTSRASHSHRVDNSEAPTDQHETSCRQPFNFAGSAAGTSSLLDSVPCNNASSQITNVLNFNFNDFDFATDPLQAQLDNSDTLLPCYPYADIESWIGTYSPTDGNFASSSNPEPRVQPHNIEAGNEPSSGHGVALSQTATEEQLPREESWYKATGTMKMSIPSKVAGKGASSHIEHVKHDMPNQAKYADVEADKTQQATGAVKQLGLLQTLRKYKHASVICMLAAVGALSDGYQVQMSGSIVALPGFKETFGEPQTDGSYVIDPQYLALWGSLKNVAAMLGGGIGSYPPDKLGRRWMILVVQIIMVGRCILEQFAFHWTHWLGARLLDVEGYDVVREYRRMLVEVEHANATASMRSGGSYLDVFRGVNRLVQITMLLAAVPLIERLGRLRLLLTFAPISIASLLVMGGVLRAGGPAVGPVLIAFAYVHSAFGILDTTSALALRVTFTSLKRRLPAYARRPQAIMGIQAMATVYVYIAPIMLNSPALGMSNTVFFWVGTGSVVYVLVWFLVPETKGRSFAELDELFDRRIPAWKFAETKTSVQE